MNFIKKKTREDVSEGREIENVKVFTCSECGITIRNWVAVVWDKQLDKFMQTMYDFNYCPNCGRRIKVIGLEREKNEKYKYTMNNCPFIKEGISLGVGEPIKDWSLQICEGYIKSDYDDEPCEECKRCKYCESKEEE